MTFRTVILGTAVLVGIFAAAAQADVTIDFSTEDDFVTPLSNGQLITSPPEFGNLFNLTATGADHVGAAIFDSTPGVNSADPDLQVSLGNVLILQSADSPSISMDFFSTPNDEAGGGTVTFDFLMPVSLTSMDLIDIDAGGAVTLVATDGGGLTRTYSVPDNWTLDFAASGPDGFDTLDLTTLAGQLGEGGATATASEIAGFDSGDVVSLAVTLNGSGALDNLVFQPIPAPGAALLAILGLSLTGWVRRSA